jgi:hypothetical protein
VIKPASKTAVAVVGGAKNDLLHFWCPGCKSQHIVSIKGATPWDWNGDLEKPTISPSILVMPTPIQPRCHSFIRNGKWEYLGDCDHELKNQSVEMTPVVKWEK